MMKKLYLAALLLLLASTAQAGWEYCVDADAIDVGGVANALGTASKQTGSTGQRYVVFAASGDPFATFNVSIPEFIAFPISAKVFGQSTSITPANNFCMIGGILVSTIGDPDSLWELNHGTSIAQSFGFPVNASTVRSLNPTTTQNELITNGTPLGITPFNQATDAACSSVAACKSSVGEGKAFIQRVTSVCNNNDGNLLKVSKICLFADY